MASATRWLQAQVMKKMLPALVLVPFTVFSAMVIAKEGYFGFITLALREPWGMQVLLDLCIALSLVATWIHRDARERGIVAWPWLLSLPFVGSIGALGYLVWRTWRAPRPLATLAAPR
ncbi:MAG: hypothetical protein KF819_29145 [Labilithrix sp.]|nr:hypothetical protein [Labilithrix sp.]